MYAGFVNEEKSSRIVFPARIRASWEAMIDHKGLGQQAAIERLIDFVLAQDDLTQSMILGQLDISPDVLSVAMKRAAARKRTKPDPSKTVRD